ncbi:low-temperature-induced 65 kDa protein-like [Miscanthus floridulus]|uniref:low-temperature-induced 65 kDa protein-like n=1 Tax=Miscanthus floridulus TaxID=154761 RepID=UPI00345AD03A
MDALTRKHVPEDVGLRNTGEVEDEGAGGQAQLHRDEKQHKPVLTKVKEKIKKIKNTLAGHGHGHDGEHGGGDERMGDAGTGTGRGSSSSSEEAEEDAVEKGGYMEDVEDKPVVMESDPEVHGAPMYDSARAPAVQDLVAKYDQPARTPAVQEVEGDGAEPRVRLGDIGGPVVEDTAAPRSTTPAAREGEDIGTTPVVQQFETMSLSDDPAHVGAGKKGAKAEERKDKAADTVGGAAGGASYTDRLKNAAAGGTEYGKKLASTMYEKVASVGTAVGVGKRDDEQRTEAVPASNTAGAEEWRDAPEATDTDATRGAGYTDKIKSAAAGTTGYGKQLASTVYDKVAAVAPNLRPQESSAKAEGAHSEAMPVSDTGAEEWKDAPAATNATNTALGPAGYTDKIKSAAAGTTEYGKQLASTVYEKVAGVGTAVAGKVQQATQSAGTATPGPGVQQDTATPGAGGQDKGVTVTGYIAEKLRPGNEDRALSEAISGAVQRRKEDVGGTVAQRVPAPGQVITKARDAVTSLTGGNRVSETVQPATATGEDVKEGYATEAPVIRGEEIGSAKLNTNTM